jgi:hypothetical protein
MRITLSMDRIRDKLLDLKEHTRRSTQVLFEMLIEQEHARIFKGGIAGELADNLKETMPESVPDTHTAQARKQEKAKQQFSKTINSPEEARQATQRLKRDRVQPLPKK